MNHHNLPIRSLSLLLSLTGLLGSSALFAHGATPPTLSGVAIPATPGLLDGDHPIVVDRQAALQLGKSLFWDMNVGSDGMACASCHFHAGADGRTRNQLAPGGVGSKTPTRDTFEPTASGAAGGPNYSPRATDFPFYQPSRKADKSSPVNFVTDDVFGSSGTHLARFDQVSAKGRETCTGTPDDLFHLGALNTRRNVPRNTPTVINAAFNFRNFWDGRANNVFNGTSPFGLRDVEAGVWVTGANGQVERQTVRLENAALASQAVGPVLSDIEMSCVHRSFPAVGRKLLKRRGLDSQAVEPTDSVLGSIRHASGKGITPTYASLIQQAFAPRYWSGKGNVGTQADGSSPYNQLEANFSFFFGLAIQLYEDTLISDQTPFDTPRDDNGIPKGLNPQQVRGLAVFQQAHCALCHKGPTLTAAAHPQVYGVIDPAGMVVVNRKTMNGSFTGKGIAFGLLDEGFMNTSVTPTDFDAGVGGLDPFGNPLSFSAQYRQVLLGASPGMIDPVSVKSCQFEVPFTEDFSKSQLQADPFGKDQCGDGSIYAKTPKADVLKNEMANKPGEGGALVAVMGAFKIPTLRNVELTGPYMHNGGMRTLDEVVDFYNRGGNLNNDHHFATLVFPQSFTEDEHKDLVAFLKSLTDERVRWEKAPFDHPELRIPHGHKAQASRQDPLAASDQVLVLPAVGQNGRSASQGPLLPFEDMVK